MSRTDIKKRPSRRPGKRRKEKNTFSRETIVREARALFSDSFPDFQLGHSGACLYWAMCAVEAARRNGLRLVVNAGSASWRRLSEDLDDGKPTTGTHFSYQWSSGSAYFTDDKMVLPEIHIWAGDPKRGEIVDLSTPYLPELCEATTGEMWLHDKPPDYFWGGPHDMQEGWFYEPFRAATMLAVGLAANEQHKLV